MDKESKMPPIVLIFWGVIIYETASLLSIFYSWSNYLCMFGSLMIIGVYIISPKAKVPAKVRNLVPLLYIVIFFMVLRGSLIGRTPIINGEGPLSTVSAYDVIRYFLVVNHSALALLLPFIISIDWNPKELRYFGPLAFVSSIITLAAIFLFRDSISLAMFGGLDYYYSDNPAIRSITRQAFVGLGLIVCCSWTFTYFKHNSKYWIIPVALISFFICNVLGGGRGGSVTAFVYLLLFFYFIYVTTNKKSLGIKIWPIILFALFVFVLYYLFYHTQFFSVLFSRTFENGEIGGELRESTREKYMDHMIRDFNEQPLCWLVGRGVNGSYLIGSGVYRNTLEWGYMWLILKGGIIYLVLYVLILFKSFISGFFHSKNTLAKALGVLCLVQVLLLIPFGIPDVSIQFLLAWHSVRLLNTKDFLLMYDDEVRRLLKVA